MKPRYKKCDDSSSDQNLDWMASVWIQDRINANHMDHSGTPLKDIKDLTIEDMVPTDKEKDYVFRCLISHFSYCLVQRYPLLFRSLNNCIKPNRPHQYQQAMDAKSKEFTGNLFTKSETNMDDLISMLENIQKSVTLTG